MRARAGYIEIVACALTWGTIGPLTRRWIDVPSGVIVFFRLSLGMAVVLAWLAARKRLVELRPGARMPLLVAFGALLAIHWAMFFVALQRIDVATAVLIVFLGPVFAAAVSPLVLGDRWSASTAGALALALLGCALIAVPRMSRIDRLGVACAFGSALLFAVLLLVGKLLTEHYSSGALVVWQLGIGAVLVSPFLATASAAAVWSSLWALLALGLVHTGVAGILYFRALRALHTHHIGVLYYFEPASAVVYGWWLLGERPTALMLLGGALVVAAGVVIIYGHRPVAPASFPEP